MEDLTFFSVMNSNNISFLNESYDFMWFFINSGLYKVLCTKNVFFMKTFTNGFSQWLSFGRYRTYICKVLNFKVFLNR